MARLGRGRHRDATGSPSAWRLELDADRFVALNEERLEDAAGQADLAFDLAGALGIRMPPQAAGGPA